MASKSKETPAGRQQRAKRILHILKQSYPEAHCSLQHKNPLELLVATILSAQCTDERVNIVTRELFRKYPSASAYAQALQEQLEQDIRSTGFYRNKAKNIRAMAGDLVAKHHGKVPAEMEQLVQLAGGGRKTANVVLGNAFGKNEGIVVDTHVGRLAGRLGLTKQSDPEKIEQELMPLFPREDWALLAHLLIAHGRKVCMARKPDCVNCPLGKNCPRVGVKA